MKQSKKIIALLLSVLLIAAALTGCVGTGSEATSSPAADDVIYQMMGITRDTVLLTVNGKEVTAEQYLFWLGQSIAQMDQTAQYLGKDGIDWEEEDSGTTMKDNVKKSALETAELFSVVYLKAQEQGCTLSEEDNTEYQDALNELIEQQGGQEQYQLWLSRRCLTQEGLDYLVQTSYIYNNLVDSMYGEGSANAPTDEIMDAYIEENDLLSAKHILLLTVDMNDYDSETGTYASLGDDEIAVKKALAEDLLAQLRASDDPTTLFDTLMNEYSEDSGLSSNPDGYVFTAGDMTEEFETATRALKIGEISGIVKSVYGYHIILRQDPDTASLREQWIGEQMNTQIDDWINSATVETTAAYDAIDPEDFYTKLLAHQAEVDEQLDSINSAADSTASPSPSAPTE